MAKNRSYLGEGVYASFDGTAISIELEVSGRPIRIDGPTWNALIEYARRVAEWGHTTVRVAEIPIGEYTDAELLEIARKILNDHDVTKN